MLTTYIVLVAGLIETFVSLPDLNTFLKLVLNVSEVDPRGKVRCMSPANIFRPKRDSKVLSTCD